MHHLYNFMLEAKMEVYFLWLLPSLLFKTRSYKFSCFVEYHSSMPQPPLENISASLHPVSFHLPWQIAFHTLLSIRYIGECARKL